MFSFSQLFKDFKDHQVFLAVGRELTPIEKTARDIPQSTLSDSALTAAPKVRRKPGKRFQKQKGQTTPNNEKQI